MPNSADELLRAARVYASELDLDAEQRALLLKSMTDVRVALVADAVGRGELSAFEHARAEAGRLLTWPALTEVIFDANEPETVDGGAVRVGVVVGVTTLEPADAVRSACAWLADRRWTAPSACTIEAHQFAYWYADPRSAEGFVRIEVHAAPGLATVTERQRQEMLDEPSLAHLHEVLRMGPGNPDAPPVTGPGAAPAGR